METEKSELEKCWDNLLIRLNIYKALKEAVKKWWVDPFER